MHTISDDRRNPRYRFLEGLIGYTSLCSLLLMVLLTLWSPSFTAVFLIVFSLLWLLKYTLNVMYTIFSYRRLRRWEKLDWQTFLQDVQDNPLQAQETLSRFANAYRDKLNWISEIETHKRGLAAVQGTKFARPYDLYQLTTFSIYNEPPEVLEKSLVCLRDAGYPLDKLCVIVSQEARAGETINRATQEYIEALPWVQSHEFSEADLEIVYANHQDLAYQNKRAKNITLSSDRVNVIFTRHPDGLVGEIKGKASNEDWGTRQASLFLKARGIDPALALVTSLDADSHIGKYFFHNLAFGYLTCPDKLRAGFQPVHVYSNNFFDVQLIPRLIATQTGLFNLTNLSLEGETPFFAIYSLSMATLHEVDFWIRDVIAEDAMLFNKCLVHFQCDFKVYPFYGIFEGDAVEGDSFFEALAGQYKQLQRWAWGGVEDFPYVYKNFFWTKQGQEIDLRLRLRWVYLKFSNHLFWSAAPLIFSLGLFLPSLIGGAEFRQDPTSQNLAAFSSYFAWTSFVFIFIFGYITLFYFARKAKKGRALTWWEVLAILIQFALSPFIFGFMGVPALDAQIRGIRGHYLGYWVTPKS